MWALNQRRTQQDGPSLPDTKPYRRWFANVSGVEPPPKSNSHLKKNIPSLRYRCAHVHVLSPARQLCAMGKLVMMNVSGLGRAALPPELQRCH